MAFNVFDYPFSSSEKDDGVHMDCVEQRWRAMFLATSFALQKNTMVFTWIALGAVACNVFGYIRWWSHGLRLTAVACKVFDYLFTSSGKYDGVHMECV